MRQHRLLLLTTTITALLVVLSGYFNPVAEDLDFRDGYLYMPADGFVPDDSTAIHIAEAIWLPIYGERIYESTPFVAHLQDDTLWVVSGTMPEKLMFGGVPYAEIRKSDCRIVRVTHGE